MNSDEIKKIEGLLLPLIGLRAWGSTLGQGSFLTIEFGDALPVDAITNAQHGEWHLWVYNASWRIERNNEILIASEDNRQEIKKVIGILDGLSLEHVHVLISGIDTIFEFTNSIILRVIPLNVRDDIDYWILYMPNNKTLTFRTGASWLQE